MKRMLFVMLLVSGCASYEWVKPGGTPRELAKAKSECRLRVAATRRLTGTNTSVLGNALSSGPASDVQECMLGEGWALRGNSSDE